MIIINKIILMGRLTRDPECRFTQNGKQVTQFTIAVDDGYGDNKTTSFINIVVWGKIAEACGNNLVKGQRALVDGRLQIRSYEAKDGTGKRWVTEVIASSVQFIDHRNDSAKQDNGNMESFGSPVAFDEEIPF